MLLAAFGDVAGNFSLQKAVLQHIDSLGILTVTHTGGLLCGPEHARELVETARLSGAISVQGAQDRVVARFRKKSATLKRKLSEHSYRTISETCAALAGAQVEYLDRLPRVRRFEVEGIGVTLCHGLPDRAADRLTQETSHARLMRQREGQPSRIILCGGVEAPCIRFVEDTLFADPGPLVTPDGRARFLCIDTDAEPWRATVEIVGAGE